MKPTERTYAIQKGDTLQKVAQQLGMAPQELRRFHNIYCEIPDLIEADFPSHLKTVLLPPDKSDNSINDSTEKKPKKVSFINGYALPFLPANTKKNYTVRYVLEDGEDKDSLHFESSVKWIGADPKGFHFFEIDRLIKTSINNVEPDTIMEELAVKTAEVLYPLQIVVDDTGKWIDIHNYKEIAERWDTTKSEIADYYEGEVAQIHIEHTENSLISKTAFMDSLRSDLFLRVIFNGIHVDYTQEYTFMNTITFPLVKEEEASFMVEQKTASFLDEDNRIKIEQKGDYIDTEYNSNFGFEPWEGTYNASYFLNPNSYCIEKIEFNSAIYYDNPIKATISIAELKPKEALKTHD